MVAWSMTSDAARGALNVAGPGPITNKEFSAALGHALRRPSMMPAPPFALRIALGEMADALLLSSQRVLPVRATDSGFTFRFSNIDEAFADIFPTR
jgi:NAD dependent epimerase/dehydratase family enzyme